MKNLAGVLKKIGLGFICCLVLLYLAVYLFLPYFLNKKDYSKVITQNLEKQSGLVLLINNYRLKVSPLLEINLKADSVQLFYPDKKQIMDIKDADVYISGLHLLKKEVKINTVKAKQFQFSTKLLENGKTTFQQYLDDNLKRKKSDIAFSDHIPGIFIENYTIKIKDDPSGQKFKFSGKNLKVTKNKDLRYLTLSMNGSLYCFDKKYAAYNIKLAFPQKLFNEVNKQLFDVSFDDLYRYNFFAKINADLKIHTKNDSFDYLSGKTDIDDFVITLGQKKLPESYFHINFDKGYAYVSSKFYTDDNELTDILAKIKTTKPFYTEINCKCKKADISNLQQVSIAVLKLLKIKNNLNEFKTSGTLSADFDIKTDLKTIKSKGTLKIKNADIVHKNIPFTVSKFNSSIDFSNNSIKINPSDIFINNQPMHVSGNIDNNAKGKLQISAQNLSLCNLIKAFPLIKIPQDINIKSGLLSFDAVLNGSLSAPHSTVKAIVTNFSASDIKHNLHTSAQKISINTDIQKSAYKGFVDVRNVYIKSSNLSNNSNSLYSEAVSAVVDNKIIKIKPSKFTTGNANLTLLGEIKNYIKEPDAFINIKGTIDAFFIKSLIKDVKLHAKGYLPVNAIIKLSRNNITADVKILSNRMNYVTPVFVSSFADTNMLTHLLIKSAEKSSFNNEITMYYTPDLNSLSGNPILLKYKKALTVRGNINQNRDHLVFNNVKIQTPEYLNIEIPDLKKSKAEVKTDISLNGTVNNPQISGSIYISNLDIPQYCIKAAKADIVLLKNKIKTRIDSLKVKNTNISIEIDSPYDFLNTKKIDYVKINAQYIDLEYLLSLASALPFLEQSKYSAGCEFPYIISDGKLYIKSFKNGLIKAENVFADISSKENMLYLSNLRANAYTGSIGGKISYNFPYYTIKAVLQGRNMDSGSVSDVLLPKEQRISGKLNFDADITMYGSDTKQQMKTLQGKTDVVIKNGHLGTLGRFEHFLYAQNLLSQRFIYASINSAKQAISPKDTGHFSDLRGTLNFKRGSVYFSPITTSGPQMSMYITGSMYPESNTVDLEILGKVSSEISSTLGDFGSMTIKDFLDNHTKYGQTVEKLFNSYNIDLPEVNISKIPELSPDMKYQTKNFRVLINGDTNSVKAVKSFTWVNPPGTKAKVLSQEAQAAIKEALPENISQPVQNDTKPQTNDNSSVMPEPYQQEKTSPDFLNSIPDDFKE